MLLLAGLPLVFAATPAAAGTGPLTLSVSSGSAGTRVLLTGTGFTPGETVQPYWNYGTSGAISQKSFYLYTPIVTAGSAGTATTDIFIPVVPSGADTISLVGLTSGAVDTASFTVVPRIDTGAEIAPAGTTLTFAGWGFGPHEEVTVQWAGTLVVKASTDAKGFFSGKTYTIPAGTAPGAYTVTADGAPSGDTATATVTVGPTPTGPSPGPDDWANWGFDAQQHRVNTVETAFSTSNIDTLGPAWQASITGPDVYQAAPTVANGIVYLGSVHGLLSAYNEATGALLWSYQAPGPIYASPVISNGIAYFGTVNEPQENQVGNYAIALDAQTGAVIWTALLPNGGDWATPLVTNGDIFFPMANREGVSGGMIAFNALTGLQLWQDNNNEGVWAPPTLDPGGQYYYQGTGNPCNGTGSSDSPPCSGQILKVDMATGAYTTLFQVPDFSGDDDIPAAPTYDNGNLYFGNKDGIFFSISATTGAVNWQYNTGFSGDYGIYGSGAVYDGLVIFESIGGKKVYALNESTGALVWSYTTNGGPNSPVVADGIVFVASYGGTLLGLNATTGQLLWSAPLGAPSGGSAVVSNGMVFQPSGTGTLFAYKLNPSAAPPALTADSPAATVPIGEPYSYTFSASGSPSPAFAVASGSLPTGMTLSPAGVLSGTPTAAGSFTFTVSASNGYGSPAVSPAITMVVVAPTDMSVGMAGPASTTPGSTVVYTVTAYNLGPAAAYQVVGSFNLPAGATFVSAQNGGTYANGVVTWNVASIGSGSHQNLKVSITLTNPGTNTVTAGVQALNPDPNTANNSGSFNTTVS
ncbi:MAG: PQQ-binding-like beta-propeller repeat protein [Trebonia sp.]|jgi:uncharacterized repeat protein (TIGR01451 family)